MKALLWSTTIGLLVVPLGSSAAETHAGPLHGAEIAVSTEIGKLLKDREFAAEEEARRQVLAIDDRRTRTQLTDTEPGGVRYRLIDAGERQVRIYGDIAIVLARETYIIWQGGVQVGGAVQFTRTYKKSGADWRAASTRGTFVK